MTDYITPEEARELLEPNGEYRNSIDKMFCRDAVFTLSEIAERAAEMIAWARVEYAIARESDYGWPEFFTDWRGWTEFKHAAGWSTRREPLEWVAKREGGRIITRLVIDLEEEE